MTLEDAKTAFLAALEATDPTKLVKARVRTGALDDWFEDRMNPKPIHVLALGKAAPRMVWGLLEANVPFRGMGVTTPGQKKPSLEGFWHVGDHPVPGQASLDAGGAVLRWIDRLPPGARVLVLLSGGASACVESGPSLDEIRDVHAEWQSQSIEDLNQARAVISDLKAGGLGRLLRAKADVRCWVLNDVGPGQERLVGSGPCDVPDIPHTVLADARDLAQQAAGMLQALGHDVDVRPVIHGPLDPALEAFLADHVPGKVHVAAGEATLATPSDAPLGGRTSHAALAAASRLTDGGFFAGASDGQDGSTGDAGAWAFAGQDDADAVARFDAHAALSARGQTLRLGSTGNNLNDLWIRF